MLKLQIQHKCIHDDNDTEDKDNTDYTESTECRASTESTASFCDINIYMFF